MDDSMNHNDDMLLELLLLRQNKIKEMLDVTRAVTLTPSYESADVYADMIDERQIVLDDLQGIEEQLSHYDLPPYPPGTEAARVYAETIKIAEQILLCDREHEILRQAILEDLKQNMKHVQTQKSVNKYFHYDGLPRDMSVFDKQK